MESNKVFFFRGKKKTAVFIRVVPGPEDSAITPMAWPWKVSRGGAVHIRGPLLRGSLIQVGW